MEEKIILDTSSESAKFVTGLSGWVNRHGIFYGNDERLARWSGATHVPCQSCGEPTPKSWIKCDKCREEEDKKRYYELPSKTWINEPLYSQVVDEFFMEPDCLEEYLEENDYTFDDLMLVFCTPVYATEIDPNEYYSDDLPDEGEVDDVLENAFAELNKIIREHKEPLSWVPGKIRAVKE